MNYKKIVVLTGAGISQESGIKTFRDQNGLWEDHKIEDVASPEGFNRNPQLVYEFYNLRRKQLEEVGPNLAHIALAKFESSYPDNFCLITQNVDDLHERAGTNNLYHMHGELKKMRCEICGETSTSLSKVDHLVSCPSCNVTGRMRPHIVWFGEMPLYMSEIENELKLCDLFISIGTSNNVYPAANFVSIAKDFGAKAIEVNYERTQLGHLFDEHYYGKASETVGELLSELEVEGI
jgi:NAD-dependent deacetylase